MSDERLLSALKRLGSEELPNASDRAIRGRLETAWTARARAVSVPGFSIRRFAPVFAALVLVAGFTGTALGASADSPLWDTRVALEEAGAFLRQSNDDRVAYLLDLVQSRTEEAARQEAAGHAGAAAKARAASASAVAALGPTLPQVEVLPVPTASPSPTPVPSPAPTATPVLPSSPPPTPVRTSAPPVVPTVTPVRTATPTPARTVTPTTTPTPVPTATKASITITGMVKTATGTNAVGACITTSPTVPTSTTACSVKTGTSGSYGITSSSLTPGQSITLYAYWIDTAGQMYSASSTGTVASPTTVMPTMYLTLRK
jgi:hypothetical protein